MYRPHWQSVALRHPEITAIAVLGWVLGLRTPNLREGEDLGGRGWYRSRDIAGFMLLYATFPHPGHL